ncbi:MAG: class I SAM-dependent methyltransferase [bacterium]|nr:class I SAM-dependent methyltransferase [bacterium]
MQSKKVKQPWPTKAAMEQIYELNLWGGDRGEFYSGAGSHQNNYVKPYVELVVEFLNGFERKPSICDLGCGDFNIGKHLLDHCSTYIGVDIVLDLITRNRNTFAADHLEFRCSDIARDDLPKADVALLRNVLQHLSNAEIKSVTEKLNQYEYLILTEHIPEGDFEPNIDIISGQGIRLKKNSGVDITEEPFKLNSKRKETLLRIPYADGKGVLLTTLFKF